MNIISTVWTSTHVARRSPHWRFGCGRSGHGKTLALPHPIGRAFNGRISLWPSRCPAMLRWLTNLLRVSIHRCCATCSRRWLAKAVWQGSWVRFFVSKTASLQNLRRAREQFVKQRQTHRLSAGFGAAAETGSSWTFRASMMIAFSMKPRRSSSRPYVNLRKQPPLRPVFVGGCLRAMRLKASL